MNKVSDYTKQAATATRSAANRSSGDAARSLPAVPVLQEKKEDGETVPNENNHAEYPASVSSLGSGSPDNPDNSQGNNLPTITQRFKAPLLAGNNGRTLTQFKPAASTPNLTGMPDQLKAGIEQQSGYAMDDVKVHYNSDKPAQLQAHAYAQGSTIHLAPGQEKHLPHEAWHVVQQKQGRVKPTVQLKGKVSINDNTALEKEADEMGSKAVLSAGSLPGTSGENAKPVKQLIAAASHSQGNPVVAQLTRLDTVAAAGYDAKIAEIIEEWGDQIGEASAAGKVYKATLTDAALKRYQDNAKEDIPVEGEEVAVKIVSSSILMNAAGNVPQEVHARDEIEAKNKENNEEGELPAPSITPDTYEVITVTDKGGAVIKYVIIMRYEEAGSLSSKKLTKISAYTPAFDKEMKKYANQIKAALTIVKAAGYHPGDMKADNTLITDIDGDPKRAILADFGSYTKADYTTLIDDITLIMNGIFTSKVNLPKKDKAAVTTWMGDDQLWKPVVARVVAPAEGAGGGADAGGQAQAE